MEDQEVLRHLLVACNDLILRLAERTGGTTTFQAQGPAQIAYKSVVDWFLKSAIRTQNSIYILCANRYYEDAASLARTLLEKRFNLQYLILKPEEHMKEFDRLATLSVENFHGKLVKELPNSPAVQVVEQSPAFAAAQRERARAPSAPQWPGLAEMAKRIDHALGGDIYRELYRNDYAMLCDVSHSGPNSINVYLEFQPGKIGVSPQRPWSSRWPEPPDPPRAYSMRSA